jgi:hypothetical protein
MQNCTGRGGGAEHSHSSCCARRSRSSASRCAAGLCRNRSISANHNDAQRHPDDTPAAVHRNSARRGAENRARVVAYAGTRSDALRGLTGRPLGRRLGWGSHPGSPALAFWDDLTNPHALSPVDELGRGRNRPRPRDTLQRQADFSIRCQHHHDLGAPTQLVEELAASAEHAVEAKLTGKALERYRAGREDDRPVTV